MVLKKTHKRKKESRMHGRRMGTHGGGARKKRKGSGHRGGIGMSGSGKRADHKKTKITKIYGNTYFGKKGFTSRKTEKDKRKRINLRDIEFKLDSFIKQKKYEKTPKGIKLDLEKYKILSGPKGHVLKEKLIIHAKEASKSAIENVKKAGGEIILPIKKELKKEDGSA